MSLGLNLGLFSFSNVLPVVEKARKKGFNFSHLGALLAYLKKEKPDEYNLNGEGSEPYLNFIDALCSDKTYMDTFKKGLKSFPEALQTKRGKSINYELRYAYHYALLYSMNIDVFLPSSTLLARKALSEKSAVLAASYELMYTFALLTIGYNPIVALVLYWADVPSFVFNIPFLYKKYLKHFSVGGYKSDDLLELGFSVYESLGLSLDGIPDYFSLNPTKDKNLRTVPYQSLEEKFRTQILKLEMEVKSIREKRVKKEGKIKAAVGPNEERG